MTLQGSVAFHGNKAQWPVIALRAFLQRTEHFGAADLPLLGVGLHEGVRQRDYNDGHPAASEDLSGYKIVREGDVIMNRLGKPHGSVGVSPIHGITSPAYWVLEIENNRAYPEFVHHLLRSKHLVREYERLGKYMPPNQFDISWEAFRSIEIPLPPLGEQRCIADFLDAETARIDQLAVLKNAVRSSVEARVVAQLDLKFDALTETCGAMQFRRAIRSIEQGISPQCDNFAASPDEWGVLKVSAVKNGRFFEDENKQLPADIEPEPRYEIKPGDLLITRANTPQLVGAAAVAESPREKLMLCDKIFRVVTTKDLMPEFLVLASLWTKIREMCAEASHGTSQSMANLKTEEIKNWPIPRVPLDVQRAVVAELSAARVHAKALTDAIDHQLVVLAERRQALITAAVTGRITV
jgi:type I restriction enzyme, S subunit